MEKLHLTVGDKLLVWAFVISYFSGILKLLIGSTSLLFVDFLLLMVLLVKLPIVYKYINRPIIAFCFILISLLIIASILGVFHPNVIDNVFAIKGLRVSVFILIFFFIGLSIGLKTVFLEYFFRLLTGLVIINIFFGGLEFIFPYNTLFYDLIKWEFGDELNPIYTVRVCGLLVGPVQFALSCGFIIFYSMVNLVFANYQQKYVWIALAGLVGLLLSKSRAVLFTVFFLFFLLMILNKNVSSKNKKRVFFSFVFLIAIILYFLWSIDKDFFLLFIQRYFDAFNSDSLAGSSFKEGRIERWINDVFPAISQMPLGGGTGFTQSFGENAAFAYKIEPILTESIYFDVFVELGWFSGILFLWFSLLAIYVSLKKIRYASDSLTLICSLVSLLFFIPGITSPNMAAFPYTYLFSICLGVLFARSYNRNWLLRADCYVKEI